MSSFKLPAGGAQAVITLCRKPMHPPGSHHTITPIEATGVADACTIDRTTITPSTLPRSP